MDLQAVRVWPRIEPQHTALLLLLVILHLIGRSLLGQSVGGHGDYEPSSSATERGLKQP